MHQFIVNHAIVMKIMQDQICILIQYNYYMLQQQASNKGQTTWALSLLSFKTYLLQTYQFLNKFSTAVKKIGFPNFPLGPYLQAWQKFTTLIEQRIKTYSNDAKAEVIISTAFNWVLPVWATACNQIQLFEKRYCEGIQGNSVDMSVFDEVWKQMDLHVKCNVVEGRVQDLFQVPFFFLEQLMIKGLELASSLELRLRKIEEKMDDFANETFMGLLSLLQIQTRSLQLSLTHLNSIIHTEKQKQNIKNPQEIRYEYITNSYESLSNQQKKIARKFIARIKFILGMRAIEKRRKRFQEQRRMSILQLIKGEQNYILGLTEYINNIKQPIQRLEILSRENSLLLFSSIMEIRTLHQDLLSLFQRQFQKYEYSQCYAPILKNYIPFFKVYTDYILNAEAAQKFMKQLIAKQSKVNEICKQYTSKTTKLAENELLQPTFRIARYEMLFQEIIKKTSRSHPDYLQFQDVQTAFKKMLTQVNNEVDGVMRRMKLNDLDREFATPQLSIYADSREFLADYQLFLIRQSHLQPVTLVVLSDLLLVVDEPSRKMLKCVPVDEQFFARRQQDNKIFRNMVTIHSDGFTTFTFGNDDLLAGRADQLYSVLRGITKESGQLVYITVLGTQEIGSTSFAKYTEYIIEVKYLDVKKLMHVRFSTILAMVCQMQTYYNDSLKITQQQSLRKSWFNSHKSKTIQARKRTICQIFQRLFNHPLIKRDPAFFLKYLNFPENFYQVARTSYQRRISMAQTVTLSGLKRSYLTKKQEKEAFTILCGTEIKLGRDLFHDNQNDEQLKKLKENARRIQIKVITLDQEEPNIVRITQYDTVEDVCNRLSKLMGLRSNRDFRLFHEIGKKELRVLQHEQIITKIFQFPQQEAQTGFYANLKRWVFAQAYPTLIFKKYYYLPFEIELAEIKKDLVRLRLMTYQVFSQVREMKYQLSFDQYLLFLAMRIFIEAKGNLKKVQSQTAPQIVHKVIPQTIFKLKNYSQQQWLQRCRKHILRLGEQISKVAEHNKQQHRMGKLHADTVSRQSLYFTPKHLCSQVVINKIKNNHLFGTNLFYVQPHNYTYAKLEKKRLKVSFNMWLAVSFDSLQLLSPSSKESVFQLKYEDIGKVEVFSQAILLKTSGAIEQQYRLNTYQSFQISQLVKYNQALNHILAHLKQDGQLNSRVKQYRDQLIQYRSTFNDEDEDQEPISLIRD